MNMPNREVETIVISPAMGFTEAFEMQRARRKAVEERRAGNALFLLEHRPVITMGRTSKQSHLLCGEAGLRAMGIELVETNRGGDVTYHGPGQLVAYPILDLRAWKTSIRWYLRMLEETIIQLLEEFNLRGERSAGQTGVWVEGAKVAAIGIGIHGWVTFHGIALNLCPDMNHFGLIVPCGIRDKPVTSLERLLGAPPSMSSLMRAFDRCFRACFEVPENPPGPPEGHSG